ncbi:hypothetical protein ZOSMA_328G00050 [Zostera marina]|uniref:Uncharacterized protein n=1 Tax=Zostera marina TaxID=29655 RepID=A0A0K9P8G0_ZOSMR|nr:hypothetical protein ZOSMA_328G00050 [Zostera marina]
MDESKQELNRKIRTHEVAIEEFKSLSSSRVVYQKTANIFFRKDIKTAMGSEEEKLDSAKTQLHKLDLFNA